MKPVVGITMGDFNGIGPEIALKAALSKPVRSICTPVLIGSWEVFEYYARLNRIEGRFRVIREPSFIRARRNVPTGEITVVETGLREKPRVRPGEEARAAGTFAGKSLERAVGAWKRGYIDAVVTGPTSKTVMHRAGYAGAGQTEILASLTGARRYGMMLLSGAFRVGLATVHLPLKNVSSLMTTRLIVDRISLLSASLVRDFRIRHPKIAVLGLNPHAGESGLLGQEEIKVIAPALRIAAKKGIDATGPYPADGFFGMHAQRKFSAVLAMYHDQGLIPLKMSGFRTGVNYSMGLPLVRTSPDHGTAFSIAGKDAGDPSSIIEAIRLAVSIAGNRRNKR